MLTWLLLPGCPFIFGPPDVSNVVLPTIPAVDSGASPTTEVETAQTGDTGPLPIPPAITGLAVDPSWEGFAFRLGITDGDGDLSGGSITVEGAGPIREYFIPYDVSIVAGEAQFLINPGDMCSSWDYTFDVTVRDGPGNPSNPAQLVTSAIGTGLVDEVPSPISLGIVTPILTTCGSIDTNNDSDRFSFLVPSNMRLRVSLTWNSDADVDYNMYRNGVAWGGSYGVVQPEAITRQFEAGTEYTIDVYKVPNANYANPNVYQVLLLPDP